MKKCICLTQNDEDAVFCKKCGSNFNKHEHSPLDIINLFGSFFGIDNDKKKEINTILNKLNTPDFKDIYNSLERVSIVIKDVMNNKFGSSDIAKKILEAETSKLKISFDELIKSGKINEEEARKMKNEVNAEQNITKLKTLLQTLKLNNNK